MATDKNTIKNWYRTGLKPIQEQFWAWIDSYWHKDEKIPITAIDNIETILNAKAEAEALTNHVGDANAHTGLFDAKEDKTQKGVAGGYAPLDELGKLAAQYLTIVDDLVTGGGTALLSAEQGKVLKTQIDNVNILLASDNVNLDNVQELVDAIETVQTSLSTILVNDLTTGGTTKALTAEMGKSLKALIDAMPNNFKKAYKEIIVDDSLYGSIFVAHQPGYGGAPASLNNKFFVFTNNSNVSIQLPEDEGIIPFGTSFSVVYQGSGTIMVTNGTAANPIISNLPNIFKANEVRTYTYVTDSWGGLNWVEEGDFGQTLTGNSTTFLKADGSRDSSSYVKHLVRDVTSHYMSGDLDVTEIITTCFIPANTLEYGGFLNINSINFKTLTEDKPFIGSIYVSTTPSLSGAQLIGRVTLNEATSQFNFSAKYHIKTGQLRAMQTITNLISNALPLVEITPLSNINVTVDNYIVIAGLVQSTGGLDAFEVYLDGVYITN